MPIQFDIDNICDDILSGLSYRDIATKYGTNLSAVHKFCIDEKHSARVNDSRAISADTYADKAEDVLKEAEGTIPEITRARELASHYRWKASKRNPKVFGDKVDVTTAGKALPTAINIVLDNGTSRD